MSQSDDEKRRWLESHIKLYPDFPKPGILFRDIMPILANHKLFNLLIHQMYMKIEKLTFDRVLGLESRGFLLGPMIAQLLKLPFVPIRKKGKLPGEVLSVEYQLEYGTDVLEVQKNTLDPNSRCLVVDDLIATGGSLKASKKLIEMNGSKVEAFVVVIELAALEGRKKLGDTPLFTLYSY